MARLSELARGAMLKEINRYLKIAIKEKLWEDVKNLKKMRKETKKDRGNTYD